MRVVRTDTIHSRVRENCKAPLTASGRPGAGFSTRVFGITSQKDGLDYPIPASQRRDLHADFSLTRTAPYWLGHAGALFRNYRIKGG